MLIHFDQSTERHPKAVQELNKDVTFATDVAMFNSSVCQPCQQPRPQPATAAENIVSPGPSTPTRASRPLQVQEPPAMPSVKRRRKRAEEDACAECGIKHNSKEDRQYKSKWIKCEIGDCKHWVHLYCLRFSVREENLEDWGKLCQYFCKRHNPFKVPRGANK